MSIRLCAGDGIENADSVILSAFDDYAMPWARGSCIEMQRPVKHADNPVVPRGGDGAVDGWRAGVPSVVRVGDSWRMWYVACPQVHGYHAIHIGYAESDDGLTWHKPELGLVEVNGSRANNLVAAAPGLTTCSVLLDEDAPPERRYVMIGEDMTEFERWGHDVPATTRIDVSADGLHWRKLTDSTTFAQIFEAATIYRFGGRYHIGGHQNADVMRLPMQVHDLGHYLGPRTFVVSRSPTLDAWPRELVKGFFKPMSSSSPYRTGWDREEVHLGASVKSYGNVCIGIYGQWHHPINAGEPVYEGEKTSVDLGLIISNDGLHFREPAPGFTFVARDQELSWDRAWQDNVNADNLFLSQGSPVNTEQETFLYYAASSPGGNVHEVNTNIGMARMPRDRFGCLRVMAGAPGAQVCSCVIETDSPTRLRVNADVPAGGRLRVTVLDEDGLAPLPEYGEGAEVCESGLDTPVTWGAAEHLPVGRFRIRAELGGDAALYALSLDADGGAGPGV